MYIEITKKAFLTLVSDAKCSKVEQKESHCKMFYSVLGVELLQIDNYNAFCSQYYIKDINA